MKGTAFDDPAKSGTRHDKLARKWKAAWEMARQEDSSLPWTTESQMDQTQFDTLDGPLDEIAEILDRVLPSPELEKLRSALAAVAKVLGEGYSVSLSCRVEVSDLGNERTLPLVDTGLCTTAGTEPYQTWGDSSSQRYLLEGNIQVVPHDRCPKCWASWDFKLQNRRCSRCDTELGRDCKVLLDSDVCPHCEEGKVTASDPRCSRCEFEVDPSLVAWG